MRLRGVMVIELTNVVSGDVQRFEDENMVTVAVNELLGSNPAGMFFHVGDESSVMDWNSVMLPICPHMIGGLLLFSNALTEDEDVIYAPGSNLPVGYASNDVNSTMNTRRGSLNLVESGPVTGGYQFVWEFTAGQANGTIAAAALTHADGGKNGFGSSVGDSSAFLLVKRVSLSSLSVDQVLMLFRVVSLDFEGSLAWSLSFEDDAVMIRKLRMPLLSIGLLESLGGAFSLLQETVLTPSVFAFSSGYRSRGAFFDGGDGYWYGFSNEENVSGDAVVLWIRISQEDFSFTEGSWTLQGVHLLTIGETARSGSSLTNTSITRNAVVLSGYLYVIAADLSGVYKINVLNPLDVTLITLGFVSAYVPVGGSVSNHGVYLMAVNDLVYGGDFLLQPNGSVVRLAGDVKVENLVSPFFQFREFGLCFTGNRTSSGMGFYVLAPYLATVNNLETAVVKSGDQTMKITYTLTEV